jgi:uncharacterized protein YdeI (YjbR/CyaY-like superfamily)
MKQVKPCLGFANREEWRAWLEAHHASDREAWLLHSRAHAPRQYLSLAEGVEEALCFGWIDGMLNPIDEQTYALRYSPRQPGSIWSMRNQERVERLIAQGRMTPAGLAAVEAAQANGEWQAAQAREAVNNLPADLEAALAAHDLLEAFSAWPASQKKQYLHWLEIARRPNTRQRRLRAIVALVQEKSQPFAHSR